MSIAHLRNRVAILRRDMDRMKRLAGTVVGTPGKRYRIVACVIRNTGSGFEFISDAGHVPVGVKNIVTTSTSITVNLSFTANRVGSVVVVPDETFAKAGYVFGASVGLSSITIQGSQPGGFGDYVSYDGSAWASLNGLVTGFSFSTETGYLTCTHAATNPVSGSFASRSLANRGVLDQMTVTTTRVAWVNSAGETVKTPSTDLRGWVTRTGTVALDPTKLTAANSNIWILGVMEL